MGKRVYLHPEGGATWVYEGVWDRSRRVHRYEVAEGVWGRRGRVQDCELEGGSGTKRYVIPLVVTLSTNRKLCVLIVFEVQQ